MTGGMMRGILEMMGRALREDAGAVTVEFMILLPALLLILIFIFVVSLYLGTASDVQQAAQTLARASFRVVHSGEEVVDICAQLSEEMLGDVIEQAAFLNAEKVTFPATCADQPAEDGSVTITMVYDLTGSSLSSLSELVGLDFVRIERSAIFFP